MAGIVFALGMNPRGRVVVDRAPPEDSLLDPALAEPLAAGLLDDDAPALLVLAARCPTTPFPATVAFFRDLARATLAEAAASGTGKAGPGPDPVARLDAAPPMLGHEYLDAGSLRALGARLSRALDDTLDQAGGTLEAWLQGHNPAWAVVGRVCFHLAENRQNQARPFAFLATYSVGLSANANAQHRPLGQALADSAAAGDREGLLRLLLPVHRAAQRSEWLNEMVESQAIFRPQAWTAAQAHRFLRDARTFEEAGLVVRVPDWWRPAAPPRVRVSVSLGNVAASALGVSGLLSFDVGVSLDGEPLTEAEWAQVQEAGAGLVPLRGRWVEVDRGRLEEVLAIWSKARDEARDGVPFHKAMRLLAGAEQPARLGGVEPADAPAWSRVVAGPWLAAVLEQVRTPANERDALPGPALHATLRPYQEHGVRWLGFLNQLGLGACLADDMGLGKTIQVLALLLVLKARGAARGAHLLVVPASLLGNWRAEAARFAPSLVVRTAHSSGDGVSADACAGADLVVTTYGAVATAAWMREARWDTVILDEAQAIKNPGAKQTRAVNALHARVRLALTGTPVENRAGDLWSLFHFLQPGLLGSATEFRKFADARDASPARWAPLRALVGPYLLRRLKTDPAVAPDLPPKTEMTAECGLTREQAALYQRAVDDLARELDNADGMARRGVVLASLLRLKQICNHPSHWLGDAGWEVARSGKLMRLAELVEPIMRRQEKVLVFSQFREAVAPVAATLAQLFGRPGLVLHGGTAIAHRQALVDRFQADDSLPFVVLSLKAGGTGLNLTAATHVVHFDRWWNPAVEEQATDRAFRIGQKHPVFVHKFVCRGTVEERVDALLAQKRGLARELLTGGDEVRLTELSNEALLRTVSLDLKRSVVD
ncbi:MAG: DEAD/DEAH box helicase [Pseudomonadota bacterium]|nr:DEAD/DEAH box helicase [Pseudomonadota bacterium]